MDEKDVTVARGEKGTQIQLHTTVVEQQASVFYKFYLHLVSSNAGTYSRE